MPRITIDYRMPEGADKDEIAEFVIDALETWGGQRHPEDALFHGLSGRIDKLIVNHKDYTERVTKPDAP